MGFDLFQHAIKSDQCALGRCRDKDCGRSVSDSNIWMYREAGKADLPKSFSS